MPATVLASLLICLCNCGQPSSQFWITGLELPPGARVISREERNALVYVTFDTPESWEAVKAYFDSSLKQLGYSTTPHDEKVKDMIRAKHPDWDEDRVQRNFDKIQKITSAITGSVKSSVVEYGKRGSDYTAALVDLRGGAEIAAALKGQDPETAGAALEPKYALMVVRGDLEDVLPDDEDDQLK